MNSALLHNGQIITAAEYNPEKNGQRIRCIDKSCHTDLIFVPGTDSSVPYFKTTGKNDHSKHHEKCGFYRILTFEESIRKVEEYQSDLMEKGIKETLIRLNLKKLDPDYVARTVEKEDSEKKAKDPNEVKVKQENKTPNSIGTLKAIVKLLTSYEPDTLATILVSINGRKIPLSQIVISHDKAHELAWSDQADPTLSYFVYGVIQNVVRESLCIILTSNQLMGLKMSNL